MLHAAMLKNLCFGAAKPSGLHRQWWPSEPLGLLLHQSSKCPLPKAAVRTELVLPAWEVCLGYLRRENFLLFNMKSLLVWSLVIFFIFIFSFDLAYMTITD